MDERGKQGLPLVDHPLLDKIAELEKQMQNSDKYRRKERKEAASDMADLEAKIKHLVRALSSSTLGAPLSVLPASVLSTAQHKTFPLR